MTHLYPFLWLYLSIDTPYDRGRDRSIQPGTNQCCGEFNTGKRVVVERIPNYPEISVLLSSNLKNRQKQ